MKRTVALAFGAALAFALSAAPAARADEHDGDAELIQKHVVIRHAGGGFLGVGLEDVEGDARGAKVLSLEADSPAAKGGVKEGDLVVRFDGEGVRSAAELARMVGETPAGRTVAIEVLRGGVSQKLSVKLGESKGVQLFGGGGPGMRSFHFEMPEPPETRGDENRFYVNPHVMDPQHMAPHAPRRLGIEFIDMGEQLAAAYKLTAKSGVLVTSVDADGAAAKAGVKAGDVVLQLDGREIASGRALREAVGGAKAGSTVKLKVQRDGRALDLDVTFAGAEAKPKAEHDITM